MCSTAVPSECGEVEMKYTICRVWRIGGGGFGWCARGEIDVRFILCGLCTVKNEVSPFLVNWQSCTSLDEERR